MSQFIRPLVGSVVERRPGASPLSETTFSALPGKTGFPAAQHRSKSAFARGRDELRRSGPLRPGDVPVVVPSGPTKLPPDPDDWRNQISEENQRRVEEMSEEERERERQEIMEKFGPGVGDILKRVREARERQAGKGISKEAQGKATETTDKGLLSSTADLPESALNYCSLYNIVDSRLL
jgi:RNA polymerase II-associated protein 1